MKASAPKPKKNLRISTRHKEIFEVIQKAIPSEFNYLWKVVKKDQRETFPIAITSVDTDGNQIHVKLKEYTPSIKAEDIVYLKLDSRDSAFKAQVIDRIGSLIIMTFPEEIVVNENRAAKRHYFHPSDEKYVQLKQVLNLVSSFSEKSHNTLVSDISENGLCIFIPVSLEKTFPLRSKVKIEMLGSHRLEKVILGEILSKVETEIKGTLSKEPGFKLGIQLDVRMPDSTLDRFLVKKNLFSITDEKVVRDEEFRRKVHSSVRTVRKKLTNKKKFRDLLDALDIQRAENQYLKQHIHLLCEVMAGLGSKLGWVTEKTVEKLIYVAYLHDIRLTEFPRVAQIATKKDFDLIKSTLTEAERKAFLEAPAYAAELARQDSDVYPDAIKILYQQKELPDGSGFPDKVKAPMLSPLSCLFILSHFFVDYVIQHPDWTTIDFIKTYRTRLKGGYFPKIFDVMK